MKRLEAFQQALVNSGLVRQDRLSIHIANAKPYYEPDTKEHYLVMEYDAALFIHDFAGELHLLGLVAEMSLQELWPSHCDNASISALETDPMDSSEYTVAMVLSCRERYTLRPADEAAIEDPDRTVMNINGINFEVLQELPKPLGELPYLHSVNHVETLPEAS